MTLPALQKQLAKQQAALAKAKTKTPSQIKRAQAAVDKTLAQIQCATPPVPITIVPKPTEPPTGTCIPFDAELNTRGDLSAYAKVNGDPYTPMVIDPQLITVMDDPYGVKKKVMRMVVAPDDTGGVTDNARCEVETEMQYKEGDEFYQSVSIRFTKSFWTYFVTWSEFYGAPWKGTSPVRGGVQQSNFIISNRPFGGGEKHLYTEPMDTTGWLDIIFHEKLSKDDSIGFTEVFRRKEGEKYFAVIVPKTFIQTITDSNAMGPNSSRVGLYYDRFNTFTDATKTKPVDSVTMYLTNHRIGISFDEIADKMD